LADIAVDSSVTGTIDPCAEPRAIRSVELIARMAAGDRPAFALFYDLHSPRVLGLLVRSLHHRADAEDVLQEVFHQVWRSAAQYSSQRSSPEVWVMLVARSRLLDFLRRRRRRSNESASMCQVTTPHVDPWAGLARDETSQLMHGALAQLPKEQRTAISLAFFGGLTHREVAAQQAIPLGTAKTRILLGIKSLRRILSGKEGTPT
jgi:RNA polymerase sigma-70 factor, ECF subfamily